MNRIQISNFKYPRVNRVRDKDLHETCIERNVSLLASNPSSRLLPTYQQLSKTVECVFRQRLGKQICELDLGINLLDDNVIGLEMRTKPMHLHIVELGPRSLLSWIQIRECERSVVVFPYGRLECGEHALVNSTSFRDSLN